MPLKCPKCHGKREIKVSEWQEKEPRAGGHRFYESLKKCPTCEGIGLVVITGTKILPATYQQCICDDKGWLEEKIPTSWNSDGSPASYGKMKVTCHKCNGEGKGTGTPVWPITIYEPDYNIYATNPHEDPNAQIVRCRTKKQYEAELNAGPAPESTGCLVMMIIMTGSICSIFLMFHTLW